MKGSVDIEAMVPLALMPPTRACGWTLARARSGAPVALAAYLGRTAAFDAI